MNIPNLVPYHQLNFGGIIYCAKDTSAHTNIATNNNEKTGRAFLLGGLSKFLYIQYKLFRKIPCFPGNKGQKQLVIGMIFFIFS